VGTGAQEVESAANDAEAKRALQRAIDKIKELMIDAGIPSNSDELKMAGKIYDNVLKFLENTGFNPDALPANKY
jgi:hypothetical protein